MYLHCVEESHKKLILKFDSNYESRLKELNLVSLEQRRFIADVPFLYKVLNSYFNVDFSSFLTQAVWGLVKARVLSIWMIGNISR